MAVVARLIRLEHAYTNTPTSHLALGSTIAEAQVMMQRCCAVWIELFLQVQLEQVELASVCGG